MPLAFLALAIVIAIWLIDARNSSLIVIVRHAETATASGAQSSLSVAGQTRAQNLLMQLQQAKPGRGVDAIYVGEGDANQQTAAPMAQQMGLAINVVPAADWSNLAGLISRNHAGEVVVVIADQAEVKALLARYTNAASYRWDEQDYGSLFIIAKSELSKAAVLHLRY